MRFGGGFPLDGFVSTLDTDVLVVNGHADGCSTGDALDYGGPNRSGIGAHGTSKPS